MNQKDYDAVFYPGGHGPLWDLADDTNSIKLIESFYNNDKPIAFVCHAPAALQNVKDQSGQPLVKGKKVKICRGSLAGFEGTLIENQTKHSVAIEIKSLKLCLNVKMPADDVMCL